MPEERVQLHPSFRFFTLDGKDYGFMAVQDQPMAYMALSPELKSVLERMREPQRPSELLRDVGTAGKGVTHSLADYLAQLRTRGVLIPEGYVAQPASAPSGIPSGLSFLPTSRCNLRCQYCYSEAGDHLPVDLPVELAEAAVRKLFEIQPEGSKAVSIGFIGGGEPTLRLDLLQRVTILARTLAAARGMEVHFNIVTNGAFNEETLQFLVDNKYSVSFSLDGPADIQNAQRPLRGGGPSFDRIAQNMRRLADAAGPVKTRATVTPGSIPRLREIAENAVNLGVRFIHLEPCGGESGRAKGHQDNLTLDGRKFVEAYLELVPWAMEQGVQLFTSGAMCFRPGTGGYCSASVPGIFVTPSGKVTSCVEVSEEQHCGASTFIYGALAEDGGITCDEAMVAKLQGRTGESIDVCKECYLVDPCSGGCMSRALTKGDPFGHDSLYCGINKELSARLIAAVAEERLIPGDEAWLPRRIRCDQGDCKGLLVSMIPQHSPLRTTRQFRPIVQLLKKGPAFTMAPGAVL